MHKDREIQQIKQVRDIFEYFFGIDSISATSIELSNQKFN